MAGHTGDAIHGSTQACGGALHAGPGRIGGVTASLRERDSERGICQIKLNGRVYRNAVIAFRPDRRTAVIALTHDPKLDDLALIDALSTDAMYVGAIGSRSNSSPRRQRLAEHFDIGPAALARLRGPIGIFLGSKTPAEIAVSVMAEVLAVKNGVPIGAPTDVASAKTSRDQVGALSTEFTARR